MSQPQRRPCGSSVRCLSGRAAKDRARLHKFAVPHRGIRGPARYFPCQAPDLVPDREDSVPDRTVVVPHRKDLVPDRRDLVPDRNDLVPARVEVLPDRKDLVPDRKDLVPDRKDLVPDRKDLVPARRTHVPARKHLGSDRSRGSVKGWPARRTRARDRTGSVFAQACDLRFDLHRGRCVLPVAHRSHIHGRSHGSVVS